MSNWIRVEDLYGERLKKRREMAGISVEELGKMVGVSRWRIYDYENGRSMPPADKAALMYNMINDRLSDRDLYRLEEDLV